MRLLVRRHRCRQKTHSLFKRPEEDHQLHCCWTGRVGEREEEVQTNDVFFVKVKKI